MTYQPGQAASINPNDYQSKDTGTEFSNEFAVLAKVVKSRYDKITYPPELGYDAKIGIFWTLLSPTGKTFTKQYSTGLKWDDVATISQDGTRLLAKSPDFSGFKKNSDGLFLLRKAISAGFPPEMLTDNIAVFDGHCFFLTTDVNPNWKGSSKKAYPKKYHPEGFEAALAAREAKKAAQAQGQAPTSTPAQMVGSYTPPPVTVGGDVITAAGAVLGEILALAGGKIARNQIPMKINDIAPSKGWTPKQRQDITLALWDLPTLTAVVSTQGMKLEGETVSF